MWLHWVSESGQARRHAPDFFVRRADGTGMLIDVRPDDRVSAADSAVFAATAPGTWKQALADVLAVTPGWQDNGHGHPAVEIAMYPDVVWLAARSLREDSASHLQHREIPAKPKSLTSAGRPAPATAPSPATQTGPAPGRPAGGSDPIAKDSC